MVFNGIRGCRVSFYPRRCAESDNSVGFHALVRGISFQNINTKDGQDRVSFGPFRVNRLRNPMRRLLKRVDRWPHPMSRLANPMNPFGSPINQLRSPMIRFCNPTNHFWNPMSRFCNRTNPFPNRINRFSNPMSLFPNPMNPFRNRTTPFRHPMEAIGILSRLWHAGCGLEELQISPEIKPCLLR